MRERGLTRRDLTKAAGAVAIGALSPASVARAAAPPKALTSAKTILFRDGERLASGGPTYHSFRIPSLIRTKAGTLLAFAEGRVSSSADYGNINVVFKRSTTNGATWSPLHQVAGDGAGTWGNPTAVADATTGAIFLFMSWNPAGYSQTGAAGTTKISKYGDRRVRLSRSTDDGQTWSAPVDLTSTLTPRTFYSGRPWAFDAVGPGVGIQTRTAHPGRLIVPAIARNFYSDDHGATWRLARLGTEKNPMETTSESTITELTDGTLYRNDRPTGTTWKRSMRRQVARGSIETGFSGYRGGPAGFVADPQLLDPACEGSAIYYNTPVTGTPSRVIFLNAASTLADPAKSRPKLEIRISTDEARTWSLHRSLSDDAFAKGYVERGYTSMTKTADLAIGVLAEALRDGHYAITFRKIKLGWITQPG